MKKLISVVLALAMLLTAAIPAIAAAPRAWDAEKEGFQLLKGPEIIRISAESDADGTSVRAFYRNTADLRELAEAIYAVFNDQDQLFADLLGLTTEELDGTCEVGVQFAYSFDGVNWVNDWECGKGWSATRNFDRDGDGWNEYVDMPNFYQEPDYYYDSVTVFDGHCDCFTAQYCSPKSGQTIKEAITLRNQKMLQGRGEYLGSYKKNQDDSYCGVAVDFSDNTLYVKARYRIYNRTYNRNGYITKENVYYSDWSDVKTYNNDTADIASQNCTPDTTVLKSNEAPILKALSSKRKKVEDDGEEITETYYKIVVDYPEKLDKELARFYALDDDANTRLELTGEYDPPKIILEIRVGDGDWYYLHNLDFRNPYFDFCDNTWWIRDTIEAAGYQPGDNVYLRAQLWGADSVHYEVADEVGGVYIDKVCANDEVFIQSGYSNVLELNLSGIYNVTYYLNGGSFLWGTTQKTVFDEDSNEVVDLTSADYTPERRNYVFKGWFEDEDFTKPVTSFTTAEKRSRSFYAKWEEKPYYTITYDMGVIKGQVYNPNPDRIYPDDGTEADGVIGLNLPDYEGAKFLGWYDAAEGGSKVETLKYAELAGNVTLYARWELPTYTITYAGAGTDYTNSEKNPASFRIAPDEGVEVLLYAPVKKGWVFDGWFYDGEFDHGLLYNEEASVWRMTKAENVTVYAKFIRGRWNINYVLGIEGVWNGANPDTYTYGTAVELKDPERNGYTFNGWYADKGFTQKITSIPADSEGEVTVYAKWTEIRYTITYDLRDEKIVEFFTNPNPASRTVDDEVVLKALQPKNKLYKFIGWYNNVNFDGEPVVKIASGTDKNVTVYAKLYKYVWGDVDQDGKVTASDARLLLRKAVDLIDEEFTDDLIPWSDFDADGKITASDARIALRMAVELDTVESLGLPEAPTAYKDE